MTKPLRRPTDPLPAETRTRTLPPPRLTTACAICKGIATLQPTWTPEAGMDPNLWRYRCILQHFTYRRFHRNQNHTSPQPSLTAPGSEA